jgi:hypothetical protein
MAAMLKMDRNAQPLPLSRVVGILNIDKAGAGILVLTYCFLLLLYLAPPTQLPFLDQPLVQASSFFFFQSNFSRASIQDHFFFTENTSS